MTEYFQDALSLFKSFKKFESDQEAEYAAAVNSGKYSSQYLAGLQEKDLADRRREQAVVTKRLSKIRDRYAAFLEDRFDLEKEKPSDSLRTVLNSGVSLTQAEILRLAQKHQDNMIDARLLCDYARDHGYELRNYVSEAAAMQAFDDFTRMLTASIENVDAFQQPFQSVAQAEIGASSYAARAARAAMDIAPIPQTVEQAISLDLEREREQAEEQNLSPERIAAFLEGFRGEPEPEPTPADDLTHQEREIAEFAATRHGGQITPEDAELARKTVKAALDARPTEQEQETE